MSMPESIIYSKLHINRLYCDNAMLAPFQYYANEQVHILNKASDFITRKHVKQSKLNYYPSIFLMNNMTSRL